MFYHLETTIKEKVAAVMKTDLTVNNSECLLSGAMTKALCYISRLQSERKESERFCPRLLVISSTGDMNFMNVFFTAQKLNIPLDSCMLLQDSRLLQQGSDITGGLYVKVSRPLSRAT